MAEDQLQDEAEDDGARPFTPAERRAIRLLLVQEERAKWFWSTLRIWLGYGAATVAALYAARDYIKGALKGAFQ